MDCIAHRGFAETNPENTLVAIREAGAANADLIEIDVLGTGSGLPTLRAAFEAASEAGTRLIVELKERGTAADALAVAAEFGADPLLSSFDPAALEAAREGRTGGTDPDTAYLFADSPEESIDRARDLGCVAVHPHADLCTPAFVEYAHEAGLAVNAWTVRDGAAADRLRAAGADGLITDSPAYCRRDSAGA